MYHDCAEQLGRALHHYNAGNLNKAALLCERIIKRYPDQPDALNILGVIALRNGQYRRVIDVLGKAIGIRPDEPLYHYNIGLAYSRTRQFEAAIKSFRKASRLKPDFVLVYSDLCHALTGSGDLDAALQAGLTAIRLEPENARAHNNLAVVYESLGDFESARKRYERATVLAPEDPLMQNNLGNIYLGMGKKKSAERCYNESIRLNPCFGEPYLQLAQLKRYSSLDDVDVRRIRKMLDDRRIHSTDRSDLHFALAKVFDDCGQYEQAFEQFSKANRLANSRYAFCPEDFAKRVSGLIEFFSREFLEQRASVGNSTAEPIFIVGMPRSGTTLVEQIVASHPQVFGGGELRLLGQMERNLPQFLNVSAVYPQCLESLGPEAAQSLSQKYLRYTRALSNGHGRVTDKMPENLLRIGLIALLFPKAKFIYCRRHPMDTGLSIYRQRFSGDIHWGYDLFNIGAYYAQYERITAHWRAVIPAACQMEVVYEDLARNQETISRRLIDFLDLPWDPRCLDFHKMKRCVHTASDLQVKQPMYLDSIGRWKNYRHFLDPLREGLKSGTIRAGAVTASG